MSRDAGALQPGDAVLVRGTVTGVHRAHAPENDFAVVQFEAGERPVAIGLAAIAAPGGALSDEAVWALLGKFGSPIGGRGDVHGGQPGWAIYAGSLPFLAAALRAALPESGR